MQAGKEFKSLPEKGMHECEYKLTFALEKLTE